MDAHSDTDTTLTDADVRAAVDALQQTAPVVDVTGTPELEEILLYMDTYDSTVLEPLCDEHQLQLAHVRPCDATDQSDSTAAAETPASSESQPRSLDIDTTPGPIEVLLEFAPATTTPRHPPLDADACTRVLGEFAAHSAVHGATVTPDRRVRIVTDTADSTTFDDHCSWFDLSLCSFTQRAIAPARFEFTFTYNRQYELYDADTVARLKRREALLDKFHNADPRVCQACGDDLTPQTLLVSAGLLPDSYQQLHDRLAPMFFVFDTVADDETIVRHPDRAGDGGVIERGWRCEACSRTILWPNLDTWLVDTFETVDDYHPDRHPETIQPQREDRP